ncbi:MAG: SLBB domain-containing protein [Nitrospinae bacterium]|nr:SLBB domain-containing protein [Nitrospinota bacterium]
MVQALKKRRAMPSNIELEYQKRLRREKKSSFAALPQNELVLVLPSQDGQVFDTPSPYDPSVAQSESAEQQQSPVDKKQAEKMIMNLQQGEGAAPGQKPAVSAPREESVTVKGKYVPLAEMKRGIQKQLSDLRGVDTPEAKALKAKLQKQLVEIAELESRYNDQDYKTLQENVEKNVKDIQTQNALSDKVRQESKPITVSEKIMQFGYSFFYGDFLPPDLLDKATASDYIVGPGDEVDVGLYGSISHAGKFIVDRDGTIPLVNGAPLKVAGLTFAQMDAKIQNTIKEKMVGVSAKVTISRYRAMQVYILGDVSLPGPCMVNGMTTVSGALLVCGGVERNGSLRKIAVIRNGKQMGTFDLYNFLLKGDTSKDPLLKPGDAVFVPPIQNTAAVAGEVNRPAIYEFSDAVPLDELIRNAGGVRPTSFAQMAQIERIDGQGNFVTIDVDLAGASRAMTIRNGDIVKVFSVVEDNLDANAVYLIGNIRNAGKRAYQGGMKLADVLNRQSLLPDTYLEYGIIERESGLGRETEMLRFNLGKMLEGQAGDNLNLMARDRIYIFNSNAFMEAEAVGVEGLVLKPGKYEVKKNMTVLDLLLTAGGLDKDADLSFAELYREDPVSKVTTLLRLNLEDTVSLRGDANPVLHANDRLVVHSVWERNQKSEVTIIGEIMKPASYPLPTGARLLDLIYAAGGLTEKAYKKRVEITRYEVRDGKEMESNHFEVDLEAALRGASRDNILLEKRDQVIIRPISNWGEAAYVTLQGEVMFPGKYIIQKGETLSNVIKRAGGFTNAAFAYGLRFTRTSIAAMQKKQYEDMAGRLDMETTHLALAPAQLGSEKSADQKQLMIGGLRAMADKLRKTEGSGRLVVNVPSDVTKMSKEEDLALEGGDALYVPKKPAAVLVMGAVYNQNAFQYRKDFSVEAYINRAGGYTEQANQSGTNIIKANGEVMPLRGGYFQKRATLGPGDVILVPETVVQYSGLQMTQDITQILYQLSLTAAGLKSIGVFQ